MARPGSLWGSSVGPQPEFLHGCDRLNRPGTGRRNQVFWLTCADVGRQIPAKSPLLGNMTEGARQAVKRW